MAKRDKGDYDYDLRLLKADPKNSRGSFRIQKKIRLPGAKWEKIEGIEALESLNKRYKNDQIALKVACSQAEQILKLMYAERDKKAPKVIFSSHNMALMEEYYKITYTASRRNRMANHLTSYWDLKNAVEAAVNVPIDTCSEEELQNEIDTKFRDNIKFYRHAVGQLRVKESHIRSLYIGTYGVLELLGGSKYFLYQKPQKRF